MTKSSSSVDSVDYTGAPLRVGQTVTFIESRDGQAGRPRLYTGELKLIGDEQLVVESGGRFFIVEGRRGAHPDRIAYYGIQAMPSPRKPE